MIRKRRLGGDKTTRFAEFSSVSLCGHEIMPNGQGSTLRVTLQITSLAGPELFQDYKGGWSAALDNLSRLAAGSGHS